MTSCARVRAPASGSRAGREGASSSRNTLGSRGGSASPALSSARSGPAPHRKPRSMSCCCGLGPSAPSSPGLECADGVNLRDVDDGSQGLERSTAALPHLQSTGKRPTSGPSRPGTGAGGSRGGGKSSPSDHQPAGGPVQGCQPGQGRNRSRLGCGPHRTFHTSQQGLGLGDRRRDRGNESVTIREMRPGRATVTSGLAHSDASDRGQPSGSGPWLALADDR